MVEILMTTDDIKEIIPHREPMLLVDSVVQMDPEHMITTTWYIDPKREIFKGHFPGDPVLPGVYTVENMAQTADILILSTERYAGKVPLFLGVNNVRFMAKIMPGDTIETQANLVKERVEKAIVTCTCQVFTKGELACTGDVTLAMR